MYGPLDVVLVIKGMEVRTGACAAGGDWHHIALSWEADSGSVKTWLDGRRIFEGRLRTEGGLDPAGALVLGEEMGSMRGDFVKGRSFKGEIAHFCIFPTELPDKVMSNAAFKPDRVMRGKLPAPASLAARFCVGGTEILRQTPAR